MLTAGCGRKLPPQPLIENSPPPSIASMQVERSYNSLKLIMQLAGADGMVGYQIDRAQIDPICHCPTPWQRNYEMPPRVGMDQEKVVRLINIRTPNVEFLFRVRAVDALGRLGAWQKPIQIKVVPQ